MERSTSLHPGENPPGPWTVREVWMRCLLNNVTSPVIGRLVLMSLAKPAPTETSALLMGTFLPPAPGIGSLRAWHDRQPG